MGFLSSVGSMLGSVGLSLSDATGGWSDFSSAQSKYKYQLSRAAAAEKEMAEYMARNSATWNVAGLRAAGINPILAVNGGNIGDTHSMSASASMPSSSGGAGINVASKLQRETQESAIAANTAMASKTKADEINTLVKSLNDLQSGKGGLYGLAHGALRFVGEKSKEFNGISDSIYDIISKRLGALMSTSAKDGRAGDGVVRPAPNSAKSSASVVQSSAKEDIERARRQSRERSRRGTPNLEKDRKFNQMNTLRGWY